MALFHFFFMAEYIPLCIFTTPSLSINQSLNIQAASIILAIVNCAAMNIGVHVSF